MRRAKSKGKSSKLRNGELRNVAGPRCAACALILQETFFGDALLDRLVGLHALMFIFWKSVGLSPPSSVNCAPYTHSTFSAIDFVIFLIELRKVHSDDEKDLGA